VNPHALAAWLRIGEIESKEVEAEPFSRNGLREMLPELRSLTLLSVSEWGPQLIALCASVGVVVVFEPEIPGSRICGVARWIGSDRALIQMSLRHRWSDIFWFSFFHEVAHVLIHDRKRLTFVDGPPKGGDDDELELEANAFASNLLIPDGYNGVLATLTTRKSIEAFAADIGVHKGIVVGRLQHDRIVLFSQFNDLRERYVFSKEA
jgi:HTH-type transcriptional regulator/antitoxin HigA